VIFRCLPSKHLFAALVLCAASSVYAQAVPYARNYAFPRDKVEQALKDMQAYSGQKLPALEGFVAATEKPLDHYERGFYQFSIELLPGDPNGTVVRLTTKITAWYADRDVTKSGYQVLPSNGRLELDFLDRLEEKLTGKIPTAAAAASVQSPRPKLDLSGVRGAATMAGPTPQPAQPSDELATVRNQRVAAEKRVAQLTHELQNLQEIQHTQGHPQNLVIVRKSGTPVFAKGAENSRVLFEAAAEDEFEFLDADADWIHITISGDSRGYVRADAVDLPERVGRTSSSAPALEAKFPGLRVEREETTSFPGDWVQLKGKLAKIYTVKPVSQNPKESGPAIRLNYCLALFEKSLRELAAAHPAPEGVVVIFDSADGGIAAATFADIEKLSSGALKREAFWQQSYQDPPEAFSSIPKP
jgi:hypothetical protein